MAIIQGGSSADLLGINSNKQALVTPSLRNRAGVYSAHSGLLALTATADTATGGKMWLLNPASSSRVLALRRAEVDSIGIAVAASMTRVTVERMTFSGNPTAAQVAAGKIDSNFPNPQAYLTQASSGMGVTAGPPLFGFLMMAVISATGVAEPVLAEWEPMEEAMPVIRPGEGVVFRQADAGVATDPRRMTINLAWEEY